MIAQLAAGDLAAWAAALVSLLTAGSVMIGIARWVLAAPLITRIEALWHEIDKRLSLIEAKISDLDGEVHELRKGHTTLIQRQADIARQVGVARRSEAPE